MFFSFYIVFALLVLVFLLALNVTRTRFKYDLPFGEEGPNGVIDEVRHARRAHYTVLEYSALFVPTLMSYEFMGLDSSWILPIGAAFIVTRISHAIAHLFFDRITLFRIFGAVGGYAVICVFIGKTAFELLAN